jgi:hypothetical protein
MVTLSPDVKLMTPAQAREALRFVENHKADAGTAVVHCESGISRSPAVAAALCKAMGGDDGRFWRDYRPNQHVYSCILVAYQAASAVAACCWLAADALHRRTPARMALLIVYWRALAANPSKVPMSVRGRLSPQEDHRVSVHLCH